MRNEVYIIDKNLKIKLNYLKTVDNIAFIYFKECILSPIMYLMYILKGVKNVSW